MTGFVQLRLPGLSLSLLSREEMEHFVVACAVHCEEALVEGDVLYAGVVAGQARAAARMVLA